VASTSIIIGLAKPYYLVAVLEKEYLNIRLVFMLDVSLSMRFAEDVKPNRLAASKDWIENFYKSLGGVYEVALIPFAGDPNTFYCPLSRNQSTFLTLLKEADFESAMSSGTDLANAFSGLSSLVKNDNSKWQNGLNLIVVLSDGGKEDDFLINRNLLQKEINNLREKKFEIHALGLGGEVPAPLIKRSSDGNPVGFVTDNNKQTLYSQLDEDILKKIAFQGGGQYRNFNQREELSKILSEMVIKNRMADKERPVYQSAPIQHWFFAFAAILIWTMIILSARR